jgi:NAD(P)-dependent dehydrogenase (short-subunit alcohol dehydrogenase family)
VDKAVLVTGAARRLGRAIALRLSAAGYAVALHHHASADAATALEAEIAAAGGRAASVSCDLADGAALPELIRNATDAVGSLTALVNNAAIYEPDSAITLEPELLDRHLAVNLKAPVLLARHFAQQMDAEGHGAIVNLIDQRVLKPVPHYFSYGLSKAGLWAATRTLAQALAPRIRVNAVAPGPTLANTRQSPEAFRAQQAAVPLAHGPTPEEIADAVAFLIEAPSVTGQMLAVDGGQHLAWQTPDVEAD